MYMSGLTITSSSCRSRAAPQPVLKPNRVVRSFRITAAASKTARPSSSKNSNQRTAGHVVDFREVQIGADGETYQVLSVDYGFRSGLGRLHSEEDGEIPANLFALGWANLAKEYAHLRRSFRYDEYGAIARQSADGNVLWKVLQAPGVLFVRLMAASDFVLESIRVLPKLDPNPSPETVGLRRGDPPERIEQAADIRRRLAALQLDIDAVWQREHQRNANPEWVANHAPWFIKGIYLALCVLLDALYKHRPIERFWLNETVARMPYFAYISMLHLYESLGWWRAGAELRKVHFAEESNELNHLMIMEALGGDQLWLDRFFAQHCAVFYYWAIIAVFVFSPGLAYAFSELVEGHAVDTYGQFLDQNEAALKALPPPQVAVEYYKAQDMYLFDALHLDANRAEFRRPRCNTLYDVFQNILEDEAEHVKVMTACRDYSIIDALKEQKEADLAPGAQPKAGFMDSMRPS